MCTASCISVWCPPQSQGSPLTWSVCGGPTGHRGSPPSTWSGGSPPATAAAGNSVTEGCFQENFQSPAFPNPICSAGPGQSGSSERNLAPVGSAVWGLVTWGAGRAGHRAWTLRAPRRWAAQGGPRKGSTPSRAGLHGSSQEGAGAGPCHPTPRAGPDQTPGSSRLQASPARTVRRTSTTVPETTARTEAPAWTA